MAKMSKALKACYHMVRRYRSCANFAYVMQMTESMELIQSAIAEHEGKPEMTFEERLADQQDVVHEFKGDIWHLEKKVRKLERRLESSIDAGMCAIEDEQDRFTTEFDAICRIEDLILAAEIKRVNITPEQLRDAIAGQLVFV